MGSGSKVVVLAALGGNIAVAVTKFAAAFIAGSSSMLSEGIHSLVDSGNQGLMLWGQHRAKKPPDDLHPLGYGRELHFWSFVVAMVLFTAGAGMSIYEGYMHLQHPEMIKQPLINFAVLGAAFLFEGTSLFFGIREFLKRKRPDESVWSALHSSKDPSIFIVVFEDSTALTGLVIAAVFIGLTVLTGNPMWDGIGSILIGVLLGIVAIILARECKALLIGERTDPRLRDSLERIAQDQGGVCRVNEVMTIQLAPREVVAMVSLDFDDTLNVTQVEEITNRIEKRAKLVNAPVYRLFIRPQSRKDAREKDAEMAKKAEKSAEDT